MSIGSLMNSKATLLSSSQISGGWNEDRIEYREVAEIDCRIVNLSGNKWVSGKPMDEATHQMFCITDIDIRTDWLIEYMGKRFSIIPPIVLAGGNIGHHLEIYLKEYS